MRHRHQYEPTPIEKAIAEIRCTLIPRAAADVFEKHGVQKQMTAQAFRRLLALHFHDLGLREWCEALGVPPEDVSGHIGSIEQDTGGEA
jgi:hypothetical protein